MGRSPSDTVSQRGVAADLKARQIGLLAEEGRRCLRESEGCWCHLPFVLPNARLVEAGESDPHIENRRRTEVVEMIEGRAVVDAVEEVPGRTDAIDDARRVAACLHPVVVGVANEEPLLVADRLVKAERLGMKVVRPGIATDEVVLLLGIASLVRHRIVAQIVAGNRTDPIGGNDVAGEGIPPDPIAIGPGGRRVVDDDRREQLGEVPLAHLRRRDGEESRLGELILQSLEGEEEEASIPAIIAEWPELLRQPDRPPNGEPIAVIPQGVAIRPAVPIPIAGGVGG